VERKRRNVAAPLTQRRHVDGYDIQPVVKILAEFALFRHLLGIHIVPTITRTSTRKVSELPDAESPVLEVLAGVCLATQRYVADLVEKNGLAMRLLESPARALTAPVDAPRT
jgi:hypothetical protein